MNINIKQTKLIVEALLQEKPYLRDNDEKLIAEVWHKESAKIRALDGSVSDFLRDLWNGKLTRPESITRARRKLQEERPELRGDKWRKRHDNEAHIKKQLGYR